MNWLPLLTAFGLGSVVTAFIQEWLAQRSKNDERRFREKQAAYIGLLDALRRSASERNEDACSNFVYWKMRADIVSPETVRKAIGKVIETKDDLTANRRAQEALLAAIRTDLGVSR